MDEDCHTGLVELKMVQPVWENQAILYKSKHIPIQGNARYSFSHLFSKIKYICIHKI